MFRWLTILIIVLTGFLILLLSLGYLLKENEKTASQLKQKLAQERLQRQVKESPARQLKIELRTAPGQEARPPERKPLSSQVQMQQDIIIENLTCHTDQQCVLVASELAGEQCWLAVNTIGAALLKKVAPSALANKDCYQSNTGKVAVCANNLCAIK